MRCALVPTKSPQLRNSEARLCPLRVKIATPQRVTVQSPRRDPWSGSTLPQNHFCYPKAPAHSPIWHSPCSG